jgi:LytS/YehU family sensor histidine kinase
LNRLKSNPASLGNPLSLISGFGTFLFVPLPFVDNGSFFLNILSYESFAWYLFYGLFITILVGIVRGRLRLSLSTLTATTFAIEFIFLSALIETNHGTSFRHRAVLLFAVLAMLASSERENRSGA